MFYEPDKRNHGLPHDPFKALVVPRPIGWISSLDREGRPNLAPYSYFNGVASDPPCVMFGPSMRPAGRAGGERALKDSHRNAEHSGEFVVNLATFAQREAMNVSSASLPAGENEFVAAGLETLPSHLVKPPRVKGARVHLECVYLKTVDLPPSNRGGENFIVIGRVVGIHIDDDLIVDGRVDITRARPIARLGYMDYCVVDEVFAMDRPD
jgi:flavin reductase (DIM6/NTAB) family NADH-FMN oxidoreductase RutF